jgi:type II secretory pathway component HofQ
MRVAYAIAGCVLATALPARADDLCTRPHHGAAIDLDVKAADVHDVFRLLADVGHVNLVVGDNVTGKVTLKLKRVAWDTAACAVADLEHLAIDVDGNILLVTPKPAP